MTLKLEDSLLGKWMVGQLFVSASEERKAKTVHLQRALWSDNVTRGYFLPFQQKLKNKDGIILEIPV